MTDVVKNITDLMNYSPKEGFINFIVQVILALLIYIIGSRLISWFCKFLKRHLFRFGTDDAAKSFLLSFIKISLQVILILSIVGVVYRNKVDEINPKLTKIYLVVLIVAMILMIVAIR